MTLPKDCEIDFQSETRTSALREKELVSLKAIYNSEALAEGLIARDHDRGAVYHLPVLDE